MTTPNAGWEARYEAIKPKVWVRVDAARILYYLELEGLITRAEADRALWKIALIEPFVTQMALNMVKGTIKYPNDDWSIETWSDMGLDDKADSVNYDLLRDNALRQAGLI